MARTFHLELSEDELKMVVVALRQVRHTFEMAHRQGGVDSVAAEYEQVEELYDELHDRLAALLNPPGEGSLRRVK